MEFLKMFQKGHGLLLSVIQISSSEDESVTRGMLYNFDVLNSPVTGHLGKKIITPKW